MQATYGVSLSMESESDYGYGKKTPLAQFILEYQRITIHIPAAVFPNYVHKCWTLLSDVLVIEQAFSPCP